MALSILDYIIIVAFLTIIVAIGVSYRAQSGKSIADFFLGGRNLPWYLAGLSMVATTFAADTPLAVTELVGNSGISGNWLWWNLLAGGMLTTFFFANLWRRANIVTEVEFIELRYSGKPAAFLRGFKALYLGLFMNVLIIGWVNLAMITILQGFFGMGYGEAAFYTALLTLLVAIYASISGLMGVVVTDAIQFVVAMAGSIALAFYVINAEEVGGIAQLKSNLPEGSLNFLPVINGQSGTDVLAMTGASFLAFFGFVWWASWYPGAEPGGGGYIAQRMMSTKNEKHAVGATLFFQVAHYCLRPWPWILVGLAAITVYAIPRNTLSEELRQEVQWADEAGVPQKALVLRAVEFEKLAKTDAVVQKNVYRLRRLREDLTTESTTNKNLKNALTYTKDKRFGYVFAMRDFLPNGMLGLMLSAFFAAFMSTISTQLNWGASYLVNDGYKRFLKPEATEKQLVLASRAATVLLMFAGMAVTLVIESISGVWQFIMECGAGLGLVLILRWYWWRINAWAEIVATIAPFVGYTLAHAVFQVAFPYSFFITVGVTTAAWLITVFVTRPEPTEKLVSFFNLIKPDGFWGPVRKVAGASAHRGNIGNLLVCWGSAVLFTYAMLFFIGKILLLEWMEAAISAGVAGTSLVVLLIFIKRTRIFN